MLATRQYGDNVGGDTPLVMLHGFLCAGKFFQPNIAVLQQHRPIITVDLPGFGDSGDLAGDDDIAGISAQVLTTLTGLGCGQFHLLGHSMGGMVALQTALSAPTRVKNLILYASNSSGDLPDRFESFAASKKNLRQDFNAAKNRICATWLVAGERHRRFPLLQQCAARVRLAVAEKAIDAMAAFDARDRLGELRQPTLIISAGLDKTYSPRCQRQLRNAIPHATWRRLPHCAHCAHLEDEDAFNCILNEWLPSRAAL